MHRLPYAPHRANDRQRQCSKPHIPFHHAGSHGFAEGAERLQRMPHGKINQVGHGQPEIVGAVLAVARGKLTWPQGLAL